METIEEGVWMIKAFGRSMGEGYTYFLEGVVFKEKEDARKYARLAGGADRKQAVFVKFTTIDILED